MSTLYKTDLVLYKVDKVRFHRDVEYALISLSAMVENSDVQSARKLADAHRIPYGLLCKILQRLTSTSIVESMQGPRGGYRLAKSPETIFLSEIMDAVHGEQHVAPCLDDRDCGRIDECSIRPGVLVVQSMWDKLISGMTLMEFVDYSKRPETAPEEVHHAY